MTIPSTYPHDAFFRDSFSIPEVAVGFVEGYLSADKLVGLDLGQMRQEPGSFIDEEMAAHHADLLFSIPYHEQAGADRPPALVYLLFEHKSAPDPLVSFQLLRYMLRIWTQRTRDPNYRVGQKLPAVLGVVLYHGERRWRISTAFAALLDTPPGWDAFVPNFHYQLVDVSPLSDEALRGSPETQAALLAMQFAYARDVNERLPLLLDPLNKVVARPNGLTLLHSILYYLTYNARHMQPERLFEVLHQLPPAAAAEGETTVMTIVKRVMEQGKAEGREEGREEGRKEGLEQGRELGLEQGRELGLEQGRELGLEQGRELGLGQGLEQGRELGLGQGLEQGRIRTSQDKIIDLLRLRFDVSDEQLAADVRAIGDLARLDALFAVAARAESATAFRQALAE